MATFIQGVTDTNLDPVLFTPDYSFLRYTLDKKSAQYEQGLKSVSSAYGELKKELSDPTNVERRDNYLKAAQNQLQQIASADLSLQQNVNAANAIFDPISTDPAIAYDAYHTTRIKRELAEMDNWAQSDDLATRKKFNQDIYNWVRRDLESLKNGNGNIANYKVQGRKSWAYLDAQDIINTAAKENGFKVESDELGKPYIVTTTGGKTFAPNYESFAKSVLESNSLYQQQLGILGESKVEKIVEQYKNQPQFVGMSNDQILSQYVDKEFNSSRDKQKLYVESLNEKLGTLTAEFKAYKEKYTAAIATNPEGVEAQTAMAKAQSLLNFKEQLDGVQSDYTSQYGTDENSFKTKKEDFTKNFLTNPKAYYANQAKLEDVIRFLNIRSSFGTRSIKADQGYISMLTAEDRARRTLNDIQDDQFDNGMDVAELDLKKSTAAAKLQGKNKDGSKLTNADGTDATSSIDFVGNSSVQVNVTTKVDQLKDSLAFAKTAAVQNLTSTFGGLYLLEKMGTKPEDVALVRQYFSHREMDDNKQPTKEENAALSRAYSTLWTWSKQSSDAPNKELLTSLRSGFSNKLANYGEIDFPGLLKIAATNYTPKDNYEMQAKDNLFRYDENQAKVKRISAAVNKGLDVVLNTIKGDSSFQDILVNENGKKRLLTFEDVAKRLPSNGWKQDNNWAVDPDAKLTEEDKRNIAEGIFNGSIKADVSSFVSGGGKTGANSGFRHLTTIEYNGKTLYIETPTLLTPSSDDLKKKFKAVNEKVPIPEFNTAVSGAGVTGSAIFNLKKDYMETTRVLLSTPTQTNSNIYISTGGAADDFDQATPELQNEVRSALSSKENVAQVLLYANSPLNAGKQVVEVTMADKGSDKNKPEWAGKKFYFPINVTSKTNDMFKIFGEADELDEFMEYSKGNKPYLMNYHEGSGVKAEIIADQPGSKTGTVRLYTKYDANTKQYVDNWIAMDPMPFDLNKLTFSEMKQEIYNNFLTPYMQSIMARNKQIQSSSTRGGEFLKQLNGMITW